jgi:hypothetical protein
LLKTCTLNNWTIIMLKFYNLFIMSAKIKSLPKSTGHKYRPKGVSTNDFHKVHWPYIPVWALLSLGAIIGGAAEFGAAGAAVGSISILIAALAIAL